MSTPRFTRDGFVANTTRLPKSMKMAAWKMRDAPTPAEDALWEALKMKKLGGYRFRRQHVMGPYIADFYCPQARLIIEADGVSHNGREREDETRDAWMTSLGLKILRFTNEEILWDFEVVKRKILSVLDCPPQGG